MYIHSPWPLHVERSFSITYGASACILSSSHSLLYIVKGSLAPPVQSPPAHRACLGSGCQCLALSAVAMASAARRRSITIRYIHEPPPVWPLMLMGRSAASSLTALFLRTGYSTTSRRFLGFCSAVPFLIIATNSL